MRRSRLGALVLLPLLLTPMHPAAAREDQILILGNASGTQTVAAQGGSTRAEYSCNDRGRGDHMIATWKLDTAGVPTEYHGSGNDYIKAAGDRDLPTRRGTRLLAQPRRAGGTAVTGEAFYVPMNGPPELLGVLARALLKAPGHRLALLPAGEASLEAVGPLSAPESAAGGEAVTQYQISGLDFSPTPIWLGRDGEAVALASGWFSLVIGADGERGVVAAGKLADLILVEGDPTRHIADIERVSLVMRGGRIYEPAHIEQALGIAPRAGS